MIKQYVILAVILASLFSGCIGNESIAGKYVYTENSKAYFILYDDGTFNIWYESGKTGSGAYRYERDNLTLTFVPFGNVALLTKNGTAFIDEGGAKYVKE